MFNNIISEQMPTESCNFQYLLIPTLLYLYLFYIYLSFKYIDTTIYIYFKSRKKPICITSSYNNIALFPIINN